MGARLLGPAGGDVAHALEALVDVVVDELLELRVAPGPPALLPPLAPRRYVVPEEQRQQIRQVVVWAQYRLQGSTFDTSAHPSRAMHQCS